MRRLSFLLWLILLDCSFPIDVSQEKDLEDLSRYEFLAKRMKQQAAKPKKVAATPYMLPGPFEPLPGRSHNGDYFPLFPFLNQYMGVVDLDPSISRHIGADLNVPVPSWGIMDIYGRFFTRIRDTTTKFGFMNQPVNMLDLQPKDLVKLISDPSLSYNRNAQPLIPIAKVPKNIAPVSCKPPLCNPYTMNYALGIEHDFGGFDGVEGDIDVPMPISKDVAYRFPFSGNIHFSPDNLTVSYGHNIGSIDPFDSLFGYQRNQRRELPQPGQEPGPGQEQVRMRRQSTHGSTMIVRNKSNGRYYYFIPIEQTAMSKRRLIPYRSPSPIQLQRRYISNGNDYIRRQKRLLLARMMMRHPKYVFVPYSL